MILCKNEDLASLYIRIAVLVGIGLSILSSVIAFASSLETHEVPHFTCVPLPTNEEEQPSSVSMMKPFYGRTGNRIIAIRNIISYAVAHSCDISLPQDSIGGFLPECVFFHNNFRREKAS